MRPVSEQLKRRLGFLVYFGTLERPKGFTVSLKMKSSSTFSLQLDYNNGKTEHLYPSNSPVEGPKQKFHMDSARSFTSNVIYQGPRVQLQWIQTFSEEEMVYFFARLVAEGLLCQQMQQKPIKTAKITKFRHLESIAPRVLQRFFSLTSKSHPGWTAHLLYTTVCSSTLEISEREFYLLDFLWMFESDRMLVGNPVLPCTKHPWQLTTHPYYWPWLARFRVWWVHRMLQDTSIFQFRSLAWG